MSEIVRQTLRAAAYALPKDRRNGRKVLKRQYNNHHDSNQNPDMKALPDQKGENGNSCENCFPRKLVLNLDDWR